MFTYKDKLFYLSLFEDEYSDIRKEYEGVAGGMRTKLWPESNKFFGDWRVYGLYHGGRKMKSCCGRASKTTELIEHIAEMRGERVAMAGFSIMSPGTIIRPHVDDVKVKSRIHLGLVVPDGDCGFEVAGVETKWKEGRAFVFDPTLVHRAWNKTASERVVLLVDFEKK